MTAGRPQRVRLSGAHVQLRALTADDAAGLFAASDDATWTYLPYGPYASAAALREALEPMLCRHAFDDLGYRRVEWKCDALNAASRRAAERFGFTFEGVFRKHMILKGRNRDTAWYAIVDDDWPAIRRAFETWLGADNFDRNGRQLRSLKAAHRGAASA